MLKYYHYNLILENFNSIHVCFSKSIETMSEVIERHHIAQSESPFNQQSISQKFIIDAVCECTKYSSVWCSLALQLKLTNYAF